MERRDLIKDQIEQMAKVLQRAAEIVLGLPTTSETQEVWQKVDQQLKEEGLDAFSETFSSITNEKNRDLWNRNVILLYAELASILKQKKFPEADQYVNNSLQAIEMHERESEIYDVEIQELKAKLNSMS